MISKLKSLMKTVSTELIQVTVCLSRKPVDKYSSMHHPAMFDTLNYNQSMDFEVQSFPEAPCTPEPQSRAMTKSQTDPDFEALFSSSPLGSSTPRLRLEPTFVENGHKVLQSVPTESPSYFDSAEMDVDQPIPSMQLAVTTGGALDLRPRKQNSVRVKKVGKFSLFI